MIDLQSIVRLAIRSSEQTAHPKIEAIKWVRRALGVGLKEAKDMVEDAYMCGPVRFGEKHARIAGVQDTCPNRPLDDLEKDEQAEMEAARARVSVLASALGMKAEVLLQPAYLSPEQRARNVRIEARARELYEEGRKRVRGRPSWDCLDRTCPYDMGMREHALAEARREAKETA